LRADGTITAPQVGGIEEQVKVVASPRNHQGRTAVSQGGGGRFLLAESNDLGQCTDEKDVAVAARFAGVNLDSINERANDFNNLWA
jgi:hypothetical protein